MTAIIIPRRHYTQPHGVAKPIERSDLYAAFSFACRSDGMRPAFANRPAEFVATPRGVGMSSLNYASNAYFYPRELVHTVAVSERTEAAAFGRSTQLWYGEFLKVTGTVGNCVYARWHEGFDGQWQFTVSNTSIPKATLRSGGVVYDLVSATPLELNTPYLFALVTEGDVAKFYINAELVAETAIVPTTVMSQFSENRIFEGSDSRSNNAHWGRVSYMGAHFRSALSVEELRSLNNNPWQLFRADPIRIYSFPSGPIIPALSGLTTTNITQSGARHSLMLTY